MSYSVLFDLGDDDGVSRLVPVPGQSDPQTLLVALELHGDDDSLGDSCRCTGHEQQVMFTQPEQLYHQYKTCCLVVPLQNMCTEAYHRHSCSVCCLLYSLQICTRTGFGFTTSLASKCFYMLSFSLKALGGNLKVNLSYNNG